jgi:multidrug efflux pump subunit AcrB
MNLRNISAWSTRNPVIPIILFAGLLIAGLVAFNRMTVINFPEVDFPAVTINVSQPGAAPTEVETQITQKIEGAVRSINGVEEISSSASEGNSNTFVFFTVGTDSDVATNQVKNAVDQIRSDLPEGIMEPQVQKVEINGGSLLGYFAVSADDMTMEQLSWFIDDTVSRQLLSVEGMAKVSRGGGVDRQIRVVVDPARMQAFGVSVRDINNVLRQTNVNAAGGQTEIAGSRQSVRVLGNAQTAYDLSQSQINLGGGRTVKLADVADVSDSFSERTSFSKLNGREVVTFSIERARGTSDVSVYDDAVRVLKKIEADNPGVHMTSLFTPVDYTKGQYESSMAAMIEGALLAIVVVFFFLRDWRATMISAIAIPLSAIPTFWFMELLGFNLNTLSLLALGLVAGVLVDDAIVEIENIVRHMRMGKSAYQASIDAADEIGLAVVATTFSIVAVFLPVGLMPGIPGEFFKPFGLTVVVAVLCSLAVARMITPMIAAYFLRAHGQASHGEGRAMDFYMRVLQWTLDSRRSHELRAKVVHAGTRFAYYVPALVIGLLAMAASIYGASTAPVDPLAEPPTKFGIVFGALFFAFIPAFAGGLLVTFLAGLLVGRFGGWDRNGWTRRTHFSGRRFLARARDHRFYAFCIGFLAFLATIAMFMVLPSQFQPEENNDTTRVTLQMVPGTTLETSAAIADRASRMLQRQPEVVRVLESVQEGSATLYVALKPAAERDTKTDAFQKRLTPQLQTIADAQVNFAGDDGGGGGSGRDLSVMLSGSDPAALESAAQTLVEQMRGVPGVVAPRVAADLKRPELIIRPRMDLAASLGVTTASLSQAIRIATLGEIDQNSAKFSLSDRQIPIRVILPKSSRRDLSTVQNLPVPTLSGGSVPLSRVAEISFGAGPTQIQRYNQSRRMIVGADLGPGAVSGPVMQQVRKLPIMENLPQGVSSAPVGQDKRQAEVITSFLVAVISGIFLVFAVLVLLYRRFVSPLVNMTSLLLAPLGGLIALWLFGMIADGVPVPISMPVYIGILMLLGIVAKNSILLIDFAIEEMEHGVPKREAIIDAGHKRAQPIVMTTVAMVAGMIPTALSLSGDGAWRAPMGMVVIGGLIMSTVLTLLLIPAGFSLADGFEKRSGPWLRKRFLTYKPGDDTGAIRGRPTGLPAE